MAINKTPKNRSNLRLVGQGELFPNATRGVSQKGSSLDDLLSQGKEIVTDKPVTDGYAINIDTLRPFFSKVSYKNGVFVYSHHDHFFASQKAYHGIYAMESHKHGDFTGHYGIPHEVLINLRPFEKLPIYIVSYELKAMANPKYYELLQSSFENIIQELVKQGMQYNAIRVMKRKEDRASNVPIDSLSWRLSRVNKKGREEFLRAFRAPLNPVRDLYRTNPLPKENPESFYYNGIDTYVGKLISLFEQLYRLKTAKP